MPAWDELQRCESERRSVDIRNGECWEHDGA